MYSQVFQINWAWINTFVVKPAFSSQVYNNTFKVCEHGENSQEHFKNPKFFLTPTLTQTFTLQLLPLDYAVF